MNTAEYVAEMIEKWTSSGAEKWRIAWSAALLCVDWPYVFGAWGAECTPSERRRRKRDDHPTIVSKCQVLNGSKGTCTGCKWYPEGKTVRCFDCRGFTDWCLKQAGIDLKGEGATSQWNTSSNWLRKGSIETMPENTLVCLFVQNGSKMEHTGFGLNNETCECSVGVQHFTKRNKKWTHWAIPRGLYGNIGNGNEGTALRVTQPGNDWAVPDVPVKPALRRGSKGDAVIQLQNELVRRGYDIGPCGVDGDYGRATEAAVKSFQRDNGLAADGICGPKTYAALEGNKGTALRVTQPGNDWAVPDVPGAVPDVQLYTVHIPMLPLYKAEALVQSWSGAYMTKESS